jgi:predicted kinase
MEKPVCYMLVGLPGSGKSTQAKEMIKEMPYLKHASADVYIEEYAHEVGKNYGEVFLEKTKEATQWMQDDITSFINNKESFIWDMTNGYVDSRTPKLERVKEAGYTIYALTFEITPEELNRRLKDRANLIGKFIADSEIQKMRDKYQRPTHAEGFDEIFLIDDATELKRLNKPEVKVKVKG